MLHGDTWKRAAVLDGRATMLRVMHLVATNQDQLLLKKSDWLPHGRQRDLEKRCTADFLALVNRGKLFSVLISWGMTRGSHSSARDELGKTEQVTPRKHLK